MKNNPPFHQLNVTRKTRVLLVLILLMFVFTLNSCQYYKVVSVPKPPSVTFSDLPKSKIFFLHDINRTWYVKDFVVRNDSIYGEFIKIYNYRQKAKKINATGRYHYDQSLFLNEIHLYSNDSLPQIQGSAAIALNAIQFAEFYNDDRIKSTLISVVATVILVPTLVFGTIVDIVLISGSCPFVYLNNGIDYKFAGELYAGALYPQLERHDYLPLEGIQPVEGQYRVQLRNELHEIENTNLIELYVYDHSDQVTLLSDKYGQFQTLQNLERPTTANSMAGDDILQQISNRDQLSYHGEISSDKIDTHQEVILTFPPAQGRNTAKLVIRAKNSLWLEYVYSELQKKMGFMYSAWTESRQKREPEQMKKWSLEQNIPLSVFVERNGKWVFFDYFNVAGPMAMKEDVLAVDLAGTGEGPVRIKLVTGNQFWDIDYIGWDQTENVPVKFHRVSPIYAINQDGMDELPGLLADDDKYYVQPVTGNQVDLRFPVPANQESGRTIILHSKGWYQKLVESKGIPNVFLLQSFRKSNQLARFSNGLIESVMTGYTE